MKNFYTGTLKNYDYLGTEFTPNELAPIWNEVSQLQNDFESGSKYNRYLAGNLDLEFRLVQSESYISDLMMPVAHQYVSEYYENTNPSKLYLDSSWVNFQKKYEFNPPHNHHSLLSFVIWLQIPYTIEEELRARPAVPSERNFSGQFMFHYPNVLGEMYHYNIPADKQYTNLAMIFPGSLTHSVSPFYSSDNFRISVSGNFKCR